MSRKTKFLLAPIGLIIIIGLIITGLWMTERLPSGFREWMYLRAANISSGIDREPAEFDFIVAGHLYGSPSIQDQMPDGLFLKRLPELITAKPDFMVSLGDMVFQKSELDFNNLAQSFLEKIPFPVYNTPGNHDVANNRALYESYFGKETYFGKEYGSAHLIFLDTEVVECGLGEAQSEMLQQEIDKAIADRVTRYIFVFMHKTLVFQNPEMKSQKNKQAMPNVWDCQKKDGSNPLMDDIFKPAARHKPVYIFAGDVGAWGNLSPYYQRDPWLPLTLVMTGLGDTSQDNVIRVHVSADSVKMDALFLDDMHSARLQTYDTKHWLNIARGQ